MKIYTIIPLILLMFFATNQGLGQQKSVAPAEKEASNFEANSFQPAFNLTEKLRDSKSRKAFDTNYNMLGKKPFLGTGLNVLSVDKNGLPVFIKVTDREKIGKPKLEQALDFLNQIKSATKISDPRNEFELKQQSTDNIGLTHLLFVQTYQGVPVFGSEVKLHFRDENLYGFNGRYFPTPEIEEINPNISPENARRIIEQDLSPNTKVKTLTQNEQQLLGYPKELPELFIYHLKGDANAERLAWHMRFFPNLLEQWSYFVDAHSGEILHKLNVVCHFLPDEHSTDCYAEKTLSDGPAVANGTDLHGITRSIHTYEKDGYFFLIDASRSMFNSSQSTIPDNPVGAIWTIDAQNTPPDASGNMDLVHLYSSNNSWNNPTAVSAHYNSGKAYEYFSNEHNRNSINGQGGNIISIINVTEDGDGMDNAFWNGAAMFYGNGESAFYDPLAKALDVGGHEMSHGVIQHTANLLYEGQSGALNESFADVFGVLIEDQNWQLGEDVVNTNIFLSGALRDMSDPHNGTINGQPGWQPKTMSEYQDLPLTPQSDNGGVHINSGIPNYAFYLYATAVGKEAAGDVFYRALNEYLTKSSQFIDLRLAVVQSATDIFGGGSAQVNSAKNAFDQVEIFNGDPTEIEEDLPENTGNDLIMLSDINLEKIYISTETDIITASDTPIKSRPSITDDGTAAVFVAEDGTLKVLVYNEDQGYYEELDIENPPQTIWRNIAVSKDGSKIAMLTTDWDNSIFVYDYNSGTGQDFFLYNPSTATGGVSTSDVEYADILEWDYTGEYLMYDAYNQLDDDFGLGTAYWDIGFMRVWNNASDNFGDGFITKLFSGLPENTSVGNPAFAKNSPYIIAIDFIDESGFSPEYFLLGVNTETGDVGTIIQNDNWSVPNFSVDDNALLFEHIDQFGDIRLLSIPLADDKIHADGDYSTLITGGKWGVWYALGERDIVSSNEPRAEDFLMIYPNPAKENLSIEFASTKAITAEISLMDNLGRKLIVKSWNLEPGNNKLDVTLKALASGQYFVKLTSDEWIRVSGFVKKE